MIFSPALALVVLGASLASSSPIVDTRTPGVYVTTDYNWGGKSHYFPDAANVTCISLDVPSLKDFDLQISSFGPDSGLACWAYLDTNCAGSKFGPEFAPGLADGSSAGWNNHKKQFGYEGNWNDLIRSFSCQHTWLS
ncbi:hypothetical protein EXIGLDRAFT_753979 [Exidia glandulosa HHB12029]|uniref:Ecp2 effector protein domain-containing protein n=1 Tax=Exidia glandulosa HHB12029 TaxID=1314781 RepID=A0A165DCA3_EXIGL|nr:hypothetical protein EXIGLDRAFT_753979 [Exidia glandulosa HHB12029]